MAALRRAADGGEEGAHVVGVQPDARAEGPVALHREARGYKIIPVNPKAAGGEILGEKAYASLAEIPFPVDIVNVYRRSEFLPDVARDFLKADARIFWAQLGLENLEAEEILRAGGCDDIVMNRCIKREHTRLILEQ
ncbi:MAG: CoA-binding protein [Propionibacterium acidifaciens]|uniref:CoA-binding protein n=1 Tax=Propionibacterium acidifaciens TaxID=556499 RepID=UPI0036211733